MKLTPREFVDAMKDWTVLEVVEAIQTIEQEFGIKAAQQMLPQEANRPAQTVEPVEEQEEWTVTLTDAGATRIEVIKAIRSILALGLKESKDLTEKTPALIKEGINKAAAQTIADQLTKAGAKVTIT